MAAVRVDHHPSDLAQACQEVRLPGHSKSRFYVVVLNKCRLCCLKACGLDYMRLKKQIDRGPTNCQILLTDRQTDLLKDLLVCFYYSNATQKNTGSAVYFRKMCKQNDNVSRLNCISERSSGISTLWPYQVYTAQPTICCQ